MSTGGNGLRTWLMAALLAALLAVSGWAWRSVEGRVVKLEAEAGMTQQKVAAHDATLGFLAGTLQEIKASIAAIQTDVNALARARR